MGNLLEKNTGKVVALRFMESFFVQRDRSDKTANLLAFVRRSQIAFGFAEGRTVFVDEPFEPDRVR